MQTTPEIRTEFPRDVREIENAWIPMPDGKRLAARIWLPKDAEENPVPAILEYLPYRKRDGTAERDHLTHPYFAGHGYAGVRVDMRGTGDSEGVCLGEYLVQEQQDALAVIDWLAAQTWCSGDVGMMGISWGGFNALQVAALQPAPLKAIITLCSTDDRYATDIHFMGGAVLSAKAWWGSYAFSVANSPPDPAIVGDAWREMWLERLQNNGLWMADWFRHQRRDDFYKHGSVCEDFSAIRIPVYAMGGWADGYPDAVFRLMKGLSCPRKALIGPWAHKYPHFAEPGPRIGFCQEALRWWDHHLKGVSTGIMDEPAFRAWIQDPAPARTHYQVRPGRWVADADFVPANTAPLRLEINPDGLDQGKPGDIHVSTPQTVGRAGQNFCAFGIVADLAEDQRREVDAMSFDTEPLSDAVDFLGFPIIETEITADQPNALLCATLSAVSEDGSATLLSYGVLNLTHRDGHDDPQPLPINKPVRSRFALKSFGQRVAAGQRLRLALSTGYWPMVFPSPAPSELTLLAGKCSLILPVREPGVADETVAEFAPAEGAMPVESIAVQEPVFERGETEDANTGALTHRQYQKSGPLTHKHTDLTLSEESEELYSIHPDNSTTAKVECTKDKTFQRGTWQASLRTHVTVEAKVDTWHINAKLEAREGDKVVFQRDWQEDIERDLV